MKGRPTGVRVTDRRTLRINRGMQRILCVAFLTWFSACDMPLADDDGLDQVPDLAGYEHYRVPLGTEVACFSQPMRIEASTFGDDTPACFVAVGNVDESYRALVPGCEELGACLVATPYAAGACPASRPHRVDLLVDPWLAGTTWPSTFVAHHLIYACDVGP